MNHQLTELAELFKLTLHLYYILIIYNHRTVGWRLLCCLGGGFNRRSGSNWFREMGSCLMPQILVSSTCLLKKITFQHFQMAKKNIWSTNPKWEKWPFEAITKDLGPKMLGCSSACFKVQFRHKQNACAMGDFVHRRNPSKSFPQKTEGIYLTNNMKEIERIYIRL